MSGVNTENMAPNVQATPELLTHFKRGADPSVKERNSEFFSNKRQKVVGPDEAAAVQEFANTNDIVIKDDLIPALKQFDEKSDLILGWIRELGSKAANNNGMKGLASCLKALGALSPEVQKELNRIAEIEESDQKLAAYNDLCNRLAQLTKADQIFADIVHNFNKDLLQDFGRKLRPGMSAQQHNSYDEYGNLVDQATEKAFSQAMFDALKRLGALIHALVEAEILEPMWLEIYPSVFFKPNFSDPTAEYMKQRGRERPQGNAADVDPGAIAQPSGPGRATPGMPGFGG